MVKVEEWRSEFEGLVSPEELKCIREADYVWAIFGGGMLGAVVGVQIYSVGADTAFVWMIPFPAINLWKKSAARLSKRFVAELQERYSCIYGGTGCDNLVSQQWLRWLGFDLHANKEFVYFSKVK